MLLSIHLPSSPSLLPSLSYSFSYPPLHLARSQVPANNYPKILEEVADQVCAVWFRDSVWDGICVCNRGCVLGGVVSRIGEVSVTATLFASWDDWTVLGRCLGVSLCRFDCVRRVCLSTCVRSWVLVGA
jgi:hypothetical protein